VCSGRSCLRVLEKVIGRDWMEVEGAWTVGSLRLDWLVGCGKTFPIIIFFDT
jgi:hypothetical protein